MTVGTGFYGPPIMSRWHPWRALSRLPDITLRWERTPGLLGTWCGITRTISLHPDQNQAERRSTLSHEIIHAERGHVGECSGAIERAVHEEAARRLIPLSDLAEAVVWSVDEWEMSEDLWVDQNTVRTRLDTLMRWEQDYIEQRLAAKEEVP